MRRDIWTGGVVAALLIGGAAILGSRSAGAHGGPFKCSNWTLRGTYGIQMQGTRPVPPQAGGGIESVIGVLTRTYDGLGSFTQIQHLKGSLTDFAPDQPGFGTYEVLPDCTATTAFEPSPGIVVEEKMVILHQGSELRSIASSPLPTMVTAVHKRVDRR